MDSAFLHNPYRWSLGLITHSLSLKNFHTTVPGICPSELKKASLLLTQAFPINSKTSFSLRFILFSEVFFKEP